MPVWGVVIAKWEPNVLCHNTGPENISVKKLYIAGRAFDLGGRMLRCPHPTLEYLVQSPAPALDSNFLLMQILGGNSDDSSNSNPATHVRHMLDSQLLASICQALANAGISTKMEKYSLTPFPFFSQKNKQFVKVIHCKLFLCHCHWVWSKKKIQ